MHTKLAILAAALPAAAAVHAGMFRDGDRVAFVGDSITARNVAFHEFVADYYLTRFPEADIRFTNSGRNGDGTGSVMRRLADDVAARRPTAVAVMLGGNDVDRKSYGDNATEAQLEAHRRRRGSFARNYAALADAIRSLCGDVGLFFIATPPFDENRRLVFANKAITNTPGVNAGLGNFAAILRTLAAEKGATFVDGFTAVSAWIRDARASNPEMSLAGDRVHPWPATNLILAMAFLRAQNAERVVSDIAIQDGVAAMSIGAEVSEIATNAAGGVAFTVLEKALPMPFSDDVSSVTNHPDVIAFNQQILTVYHLPDGDWTLSIDGRPVATANAWEWENGVNLAFNPATPQFAQARRVMAAHREAAERAYLEESDYLRVRDQVIRDLKSRGQDPASPEARSAYFEETLPKVSYWKPGRLAWEGARDNWERIDELAAAFENVWPSIRALAKPVPHRYELSRKVGE